MMIKGLTISAALAVTAAVGTVAMADDNPRPATAQKATHKSNEHSNAAASSSASGQTNGSAVNKANASADTAADSANRSAVGESTQDANQKEAAAADARANADDANKKRNRPSGATNLQKKDDTAVQIGDATTNATDGIATGVKDMTEATDHGGHYDPFAIELNPIGLFVGGRVSINAEWVPTTHHALVLSPHIIHTTADVATSGSSTQSQAFSGFGGELGYRYYTGHRGPNGVFVGPSLIVGFYNAGLPSGDQAFTDIGIAGDVGYQQIFWNHLVVGGGVGLEYLAVSHDFHDLPTGPSEIASSGLKPRLLLEAGYGF